MAGQQFDLLAFVFMPEHIHMLVFPKTATATISRLLAAIKRPHSFRVKQALVAERDPLLNRLTIRERPGRMTFRFWQEGGGYDRNLVKEKTLGKVIDYIHHNPVRRGLCESPGNWKWSSWRHYNVPDDPRDPDLPVIAELPEGVEL
jgi:putative transposase